MPIAINPVARPERKERKQTDMDRLFKALQIANAGMNIAVNYDSFRRRDAQDARAQETLEMQKARDAESRRASGVSEKLQREQFDETKRAAGESEKLDRDKLAETRRRNLAAEDANRIKRQEKELARKEKAGELKQHEAKAHLFANRIEQAQMVFDELDEGGFERGSIARGVESGLPTLMQTEEGQRQEQAERNFVNAVLRRESGAVISEAEFENAEKQYFPRAGNTPKVVAQKRRNREIVLENFKKEAGNNFKSIREAREKTADQKLLENIMKREPELDQAEALRVMQDLKQQRALQQQGGR